MRSASSCWIDLGGALDQADDVAHAEDAAGDAARDGSASSASSFSPVPANLIGLPVTARIDSAAPPRASPSMRVSTTPVSGTCSEKLVRDVDRVLAGQRCRRRAGFPAGFAMSATAFISSISA